MFPEKLRFNDDIIDVGDMTPGIFRRRDLNKLKQGINRANFLMCNSRHTLNAAKANFPKVKSNKSLFNIIKISDPIDVKRPNTPKTPKPGIINTSITIKITPTKNKIISIFMNIENYMYFIRFILYFLSLPIFRRC